MSQLQPTVAAIVAAYNEEATIGPIIQTLVESKCFREVIVVSDGSFDRTADVARTYGASLVHQFPFNQGKGAALMYGVAHTDAEVLFFCDADLIGLTADHVHRILNPVQAGQAAMMVGLWDRGKWFTKLYGYLPVISGQRAMRRMIFENIPDQYLQGYMVESASTYYCQSHKLLYSLVELPGLRIRHKVQKIGWIQGLRGYVDMIRQVIYAMLVIRIARFRGEF